MRTLVITPCSAKKRGSPPDLARAADLADPDRRQELEIRLAAHASPAMHMYAGTHHQLVLEGLQAVWDRWGRGVLELVILSGGYGILRADEEIIPYDVSLSEFEETELADWIGRLGVHGKAAHLVRDYDLVFYLLSGRYLSSLGLPLDVPETIQQIVLTTQEDVALVPAVPSLHPLVADGPVAARRWHVKAPHVRGFLFGRLCGQISQFGPAVLEWLYRYPGHTERLFYKRAQWRPQFPLW
jgi:hypothetical protein